MESKVLVIGAGPVGLMVALRLAQAGIKVDVIEKEASLSEEPRAVAYYAGALTSLQRAGLIEDMLKEGFETTGLCWRKPLVDDGKGGKKFGGIIARLPVPSETNEAHGIVGTLNLPQSKLLKLLFRKVNETGFVSIHFNTALTSIEQHADHVVATVVKSDTNTTIPIKASFLVGADGGRSKTRNLLNIAFKGHSWPEYIVATEFLCDIPGTDLEFATTFTVHPVNYGLITPLEEIKPGTKTLYRCSIGVNPLETRPVEELTSKSYVEHLLNLMIPGPRPLQVEIVKSSTYRTHQLCASTFRRGRCILAGDAAHLNHPWGAMGLTTGLIDAEALADILEMILIAGKSPDLLDIYSHTRQKAFQFFVNPFTTQNKLRCANDPETAHQDWLLGRLATDSTKTKALQDYGRRYHEEWRIDVRAAVQQGDA